MVEAGLNKSILPREKYPAGGQVEVTPQIQEIASKFEGLQITEQFNKVHDWIYKKLEMLPYDKNNPEIVEEEALRRWKLTADEVLKIGTLYEGKECNDVVMIFMAIMKALGYDAKLAKVFRKKQEGTIFYHSIPIITNYKDNKTYAVEAGAKNEFGFVEGQWDFDTGPVTIELLKRNWYVWKVGDDQWSMGLTDSSQQASMIEKDALQFYSQQKLDSR